MLAMPAMLTPLLAVFIALAIADARLTWLVIRRKNGMEINPVIRWFIEKIGLVPTLIAKTVALIALGMYSQGDAQVALTVLYAAVVLWNLYQYRKR